MTLNRAIELNQRKWPEPAVAMFYPIGVSLRERSPFLASKITKESGTHYTGVKSSGEEYLVNTKHWLVITKEAFEKRLSFLVNAEKDAMVSALKEARPSLSMDDIETITSALFAAGFIQNYTEGQRWS